MRRVIIVGAMLLLQACANQSQRAQEAVEADLPTLGKFDSRTVTFRDVTEYPGGIVCGEYSTDGKARNSSYKSFVYSSSWINRRPIREDKAVYCNQDSKLGLCNSSGICYNNESSANLLKVSKDMKLLLGGLELYETDNYRLPTSEQGLTALVQASTIPPVPKTFRQGGYIKEIPLDPWGAPYYFKGPVFGGTRGKPTIVTLGANRTEGGTGQDTDIKLRHIKYIDHIARLK
jgi:general secretion pathway protein G